MQAPTLLAGVWTPTDVMVLVRLGLLPGGTEVLRVTGVDVAGDARLAGTWWPGAGVTGSCWPAMLWPPASGSHITCLETGLLLETLRTRPDGWLEVSEVAEDSGSWRIMRGGAGGGPLSLGAKAW